MFGANKTMGNCEFRYLHNQSSIYVLTKKPLSREQRAQNAQPNFDLRTRLFYTVPYSCKNSTNASNVVVGFLCSKLCKHAIEPHSQTSPNPEYEPLAITMCELQELCKTLRIPLVVVINSKCDLNNPDVRFEISYTGIENTHVEDLHFPKQ